MTDQEKLEQRVRLGVEVETAKENLAHERERTLRYADHLETWAAWLRSEANLEPSAADFVPGGNVAEMNLKTDGKYRECLSYEALLRAQEGLRSARQKASNLELRRMQLSSPSGFQVKI